MLLEIFLATFTLFLRHDMDAWLDAAIKAADPGDGSASQPHSADIVPTDLRTKYDDYRSARATAPAPRSGARRAGCEACGAAGRSQPFAIALYGLALLQVLRLLIHHTARHVKRAIRE
jgi:hypothetical protein